ncbi:hypothetical protein C7974DRAFT_408274 [Boeremia exigua]|uniref:uncharacterized protein n=1 Tax=Boeremia exigua TaxID=749465 RepID=UPI001E8D1AA4|nr:uncharacterized protein C7974DRAFT_408274 [Boeremia exigua]KAH6644606.1 hypothetical protein C7974DRAFT_408274 [Boeremia exigua]
MPRFEKSFYKRDDAVAARSDEEVEAFHKERQIAIKGTNLPKPVRFPWLRVERVPIITLEVAGSLFKIFANMAIHDTDLPGAIEKWIGEGSMESTFQV